MNDPKDELSIVEISALREVPVDPGGKRRCVGCGGWKLEGEHTSVFMPVLVETNVYGWICELCLIRRLERRADIVTGTSSPPFQVKRRTRQKLRDLGDRAALKKVGGR